MYLKRLEIKGFKSFAEKTVLDFLPYKNNRYSITAIVGPNGSGKSNVSDAIRWVMGEQSLKTLRGKKTEDVIFNGSEVKGQLGAAEVTMILDNTPGLSVSNQSRLMSDFPEITVARRLYRSGESEYLINNNQVRLLDIYMFLAQAQFAQHSYSVVGQGTIDKLLTVSPAERKDFLDEASGIKEFQIKQHQSNLKMARTRENLEQAERLVEEVEPRLKILARQVKKLEQRQEVEIKLRENQEQYYASVYLANRSELDKLNSILTNIDLDYREAFKELEIVQKELAELARETEQETKPKTSDAASQAIIEQRLALDQISKEKTNAQLKIFNLEKKIFQDQSEQHYRQVSGFSAAQTVLENKDKFGIVHGLVAELGEVEEKYQTALDVAAGSYLSAVVVADDGVAKSAIEFLRDNRLGVATFLPLNKINPRTEDRNIENILSQPGVVGLAADIVKHEAKFDIVFSFVFGQTVIVEDLSVAQKIGIGQARMVTLAGDLVEKNGVMKGGYRQIKKDRLGFSSHILWDQGQVLAQYQEQINAEKEKIIGLEAQYEAAKATLLEFESKREADNSKTKLLKAFSLQETMQKRQNVVNEVLARRNDLKIEVAKLETKQETIAEEVRAELSSMVETIIERQPELVTGERLATILNEIQKLKYQLSLIGGIDKEVVGEYQQSKERFDFLSEQITDLRTAMTDLEKMIIELDEVMKKKRSASFKKIRKEFDRYIKILFGGGNGDIFEIYNDQVDIRGEGDEMGETSTTESKPKNTDKTLVGIDISINPPGKKVKNIHTLSGGERTLASIALICAILSYNPSPFVVLDEVEAALDETNTRRFAQIVTELSSQSQFIIITHNRVTMHAADALYGVVMNNDGISKLLSVKLEQVSAYTETAN